MINRLNHSAVMGIIGIFIIIFYPIKIGWMNNPFGIGFSTSIYRLGLVFILFYLFSRVSIINDKSIDISFIRFLKIDGYLLYVFLSLILCYSLMLITGGIEDYATTRITSIFRSQYYWPITQFISFFVEAIIPFAVIASLPIKYFPKISKILFFSIHVFVIFGIIQWIAHRNMIVINVMPESGAMEQRAFSVFAEPKMFGTYLVGSVVFTFYNKDYNLKHRILLILLSLIALILTLSTSAFLGIILIGSFFLLKNLNVRSWIFILSIFLIIISIIINNPYINQIFDERIYRRLYVLLALSGGFETQYNIDEYSYGRTIDGTVFYYLFDLINKPLAAIFGYGYGNIGYGILDIIEKMFSYYDYRSEWRIHTRLYFYQLLVETGIIGVFYYFYIHHRAVKLINKYKKINILTALKFGMIAHLLSSMIEIHFYSFIFMGVGILGVRYFSNDSQNKLSINNI